MLREIVPIDSSFDSGSSDDRWICSPDGSAGSECTLDLGALAPGAAGSVNFAVTTADAWSAGTTTIANTVSIDVDGADSAPEDNIGNADVPVDGGVDLAVSIVSDGNPLYYDGLQPTPVYTITYSNSSVSDQPAVAELVEVLPAGTNSNVENFLNGWQCDSIYSGGTCTYQLGEVAPGAGGTVTFTFSASVYAPPANVVTNTVSIRDVSGVSDFNPTNDSASVVTPYELGFAILPSQEVVTVNGRGAAVLTGTVNDESDTWTLLYAGQPHLPLGTITETYSPPSWEWTYPTIDGPDESQLVTFYGDFNEGYSRSLPYLHVDRGQCAPNVGGGRGGLFSGRHTIQPAIRQCHRSWAGYGHRLHHRLG